MIFSLELMQGCKEGVLFLHSWFWCAKATVHLCTFPFQEPVTCLWGFHSFEKCVFVVFLFPSHPKLYQSLDGGFKCLLKFFIWDLLGGFGTKILHKREGNANQAFHLSEVTWKSGVFKSNCVNERGPKEKTVSRSRRKASAWLQKRGSN